jgi:Zn-dependent M16 (insulinase) family peptidase
MKHYRTVKKTELKELNATLHELIHEKSGAKILHIEADDPENVFSLSFKTVPHTSDGVAHILEHTVLCGSKRFPVKDPFFGMLRRSLHTFMNAMTGADFTCYPAATQVETDFYNLLDVYLDAVFFPTLNPLSFLQEGIRLEYQKGDDPTTPLEYKGIVFNEMKGALASGSARLAELMNEALYPDVTYGINSGGDPKVIPDLTYEKLKSFHETFYHPSRCLFYFYGNLPLEKHLDFLHEKVLQHAVNQPPLPEIPTQKRFTTPKKIAAAYPVPAGSNPEGKTLIGLGWVTTDIKDQLSTLAMTVLALVLMDNDASVLKKALLGSPLCKQATCHIDTEMRQCPFILNLKGCPEGSGETLETLVLETLKSVYHDGIPKDRIESVIHQLELSRSEIGGEGYPHGLSLYFRSALQAQHGVEPEEGLLIHTVFKKLQDKIESEPRFLENLLKKELIDNPHRVLITLTPSETIAKEEIDAEEKVLKAIADKLQAKEKKALVEAAQKLQAFQEEQEDQNLDILPKLTLDDVPKAGQNFPLARHSLGQTTLYTHEAFTNGLVYADLIFDLPAVTAEELPYLRLLANTLAQMGAGGKNYIDTLNAMQEHTGGIFTILTLNIQADDVKNFSPSLHFKGKALTRKKKPFFALLKDFATQIDWEDTARFQEIFEKHYTGLIASLQNQALRYAMNLAASPLSAPLHVSETWFGISYVDFIRSLKENPLAALKPLKALYQKITATSPKLIVTADAPFLKEAAAAGYWGFDTLHTQGEKPGKWLFSTESIPCQGRKIASQVAFTAKALPALPFAHPDTAALEVAAHLFDNLTLHAKIREQGGAYGGGATANSCNGSFTFFAYRDPNIKSTLDAFEQSIEGVLEGDFTDQDLEEAKLEIIQHLDAPVAPGHRGEVAYSWLSEGKTYPLREAHRKKVLNLTKDEVIAAVKEHIVPSFAKARVVIFAGKDLLEKENKELAEPLTLYDCAS